MAVLLLPGNASQADVRLNKTFSAGTNYNASGSMPENPSPTTTLTSQGAITVVSQGYNPGGTITVGLPDNGSQSATLTTQGASKTVPAGYMSTPATITVALPSKSAQTYTPGTSNQTISAGQYLSGDQTILGDANLIASNILNTATIFNVPGTAINGAGMKKFASGTGTTDGSWNCIVSGLSFKPLWIQIAVDYASGQTYLRSYVDSVGLGLASALINDANNTQFKFNGTTYTAYYSVAAPTITSSGFTFALTSAAYNVPFTWVAMG